MSDTTFENLYKKDLLTKLATATDEVDALRWKVDRMSADNLHIAFQDFMRVRRLIADAVASLDEARKLIDA